MATLLYPMVTLKLFSALKLGRKTLLHPELRHGKPNAGSQGKRLTAPARTDLPDYWCHLMMAGKTSVFLG
jgi:hypothetical protein